MRRLLDGLLWIWVALAVLPGSAATNGFRFAILGDRTGRALPAVYEQAMREAGAFEPSFVIHVGDIIEGGRDSRAAAEWQTMRRVWDRYAFPRYFTPGNHDIWSEASRRIYISETGRPPFYSFDYQNAHFTVLDNSARPELSASQMAFLERDLEAHRNREPKFVFCHQPFWGVFLALGSGEFPLHRAARKYGVDYVVSGHKHQFLRMECDGVRYLDIGSSGADITHEMAAAGFEQGWFYQFVAVEVKGEKARLTVRELGPPAGRGRAIRLPD